MIGSRTAERPAPPATTFALPPALSATEPPEAHGLARDEVRLLVADARGVHHSRFRDLGRFLSPGDLVVVNTTATLPAAISATRSGGHRVDVHFSTPDPDGTTDPSLWTIWTVELRRTDGHGPVLDGRPGEVVTLASGTPLRLISPAQDPVPAASPRLWRAHLPRGRRVEEELAQHGRPITYGYLAGRWPLDAYQPVFARTPGSAEMASASRPFSDALVTELITRGIALAPVLLHTGVSSPEADEPPQPERFRVPEVTARLINHTRAFGGRIVAVGTTVTRALESVAREDGSIRTGEGWTELVLGPDRPARTVDGLITGWHAPDASHLLLLEAVAGPELVARAYDEALSAGYRWHEFGDSALFLPAKRAGPPSAA